MLRDECARSREHDLNGLVESKGNLGRGSPLVVFLGAFCPTPSGRQYCFALGMEKGLTFGPHAAATVWELA